MNFGPPSQDQPNLNWDQPLNLFSTDLPSQETAEIPCFTNDTLSSMHANRLLPFPAFSADSYAAIASQFCLSEPGRLSRVSSSKALKADESPIQSEIGDGDSSVTNIASVSGDRFMKKRKAAPKSKAKVEEENYLNSKKCHSFEDSGYDDGGVRPKEDQIQNGDKKNRKVNGSNAIEPPTGYIHVRARRGQATDSHSLAERVRREKISQRMKLLQDLVPGCNKITGKALMLDEIINYVQSLQRQVEFLSMKLATVNPQLDFSFEDFIKKEVHLAAAFPLAHQPKDGNHPFPLNFASAIDPSCPISQFEPFLYQPSSIQASLDMFIGSNSQAGNLLDDVLQASFVQNQEIGMRSQSFHGQLPATHMKIEF